MAENIDFDGRQWNSIVNRLSERRRDLLEELVEHGVDIISTENARGAVGMIDEILAWPDQTDPEKVKFEDQGYGFQSPDEG